MKNLKLKDKVLNTCIGLVIIGLFALWLAAWFYLIFVEENPYGTLVFIAPGIVGIAYMIGTILRETYTDYKE